VSSFWTATAFKLTVGDSCTFGLMECIHGVAIGQVLGVWKGEECLGSGVIEETWDPEEFPLIDPGVEVLREMAGDEGVRMSG
jgi:hypothetical protein